MLTRYQSITVSASLSCDKDHCLNSKARNDWTNGDRWTYLAWSSHIQSGQLRSRRIILTSLDPIHSTTARSTPRQRDPLHNSEIHSTTARSTPLHALTVTVTSRPRPAHHHTSPHQLPVTNPHATSRLSLTSHQPARHLPVRRHTVN